MADMAVSVKIAKIFPNCNVIKQSGCSYLELEKLREMIILVLVLEKKSFVEQSYDIYIYHNHLLTSYDIYIYNQLIPSRCYPAILPRYSRNVVCMPRILDSNISVVYLCHENP